MKNVSFTHDTMTIDGQTIPAEYSVTPSETVIVFITVEEQGQPCRMRIRIEQDHPCYSDALKAARPQTEAPTLLTTIEQDMAIALAPLELPAADPEPAAEVLTPDEISAAERVETLSEDKPRREVPEKFFVGMELKGRGWVIEFSGSYDRTRVIFKKKPSDRALEAVKRHGFYWSPVMKSWNKKLTHKAWRAAQSLAFELKVICG